MVKVIRNIASVIVPNFTCKILGMSVTGRSLHAGSSICRYTIQEQLEIEKCICGLIIEQNDCTWDVTEGVPNAGTFASFLVCALVLQCK
jgi:hypothetical protein